MTVLDGRRVADEVGDGEASVTEERNRRHRHRKTVD